MKKELLNMFNKQINSEFYTSYLYCAISTRFDKIMMKSFSMYMKHKASCELELAQKMFDYLILRDEELSFSKISEPVLNFTDISEIFSHIYTHEQNLLKQLHELSLKAQNYGDFGAKEFIEEIIKSKIKTLNITKKMVCSTKMSSPKEDRPDIALSV